MEQTIFFEHYRISTNEEGSRHELGRIGPAINYKAIDLRSKDPVILQLIPITLVDPKVRQEFEERARAVQKLDHVNVARVNMVGVDHDYIGLVSEYVEGETAEAWVVAHGAMPMDAVLRIGLQVVRALGAAAFDGLTHRAIQPSNLMIVRGQSADGGWPFIKLLNFGLSGHEIYSSGAAAPELASAASPPFASPEQLLNKPLDFRSEIYSLGATMCFLLTGAVPLAVTGMKARLRARRLPELRKSPKALRNLLFHMLRENPENRPHDPVAFEAEMRDCLTKVERRQAIGRKLGIPLAAVVPRSTSTPTPAAQVVRGVLAFAALLLTAAVVCAFFLPEDKIPFWHRNTEIGVPVGVPDSSPVTNKAPSTRLAVAPVAPSIAPPVQTQAAPASAPVISATPIIESANQVAANPPVSEPAPPAQGPDDVSPTSGNVVEQKEASSPATVEQSPPPEIAKQANPTDSQQVESGDSAISSSSPAKTNSVAVAKSSRPPTSKRGGSVQRQPNESRSSTSRVSTNSVRARFVGMTPDGRIILRLPSGRTVVATPRPEDDIPAIRRQRRVIERREVVSPSSPFQPFDPGY